MVSKQEIDRIIDAGLTQLYRSFRETRALLHIWWQVPSYRKVLLAGCAAGLLVGGLFVRLACTGGEADPRIPCKLLLAVQRSGQIRRATEGEKLQAADQLGFFYTARQPGFLMILHAGQDGNLTPLFPRGARIPGRIKAGIQQGVGDPTTLGPPRGCEWVVGVFSPQVFDFSAALDRVLGLIHDRDGCALPRFEGQGSAGAPFVIQAFPIR